MQTLVRLTTVPPKLTSSAQYDSLAELGWENGHGKRNANIVSRDDVTFVSGAVDGHCCSAKPSDTNSDRAGHSCGWLAQAGLKISDAPSNSDEMRLIVDYDNTLYIDGKRSDISQVRNAVSAKTQATGVIPFVVIEPHPQSRRQAAIQITKEVNEAGVSPRCLAER
jgi:hypothetical protein